MHTYICMYIVASTIGPSSHQLVVDYTGLTKAILLSVLLGPPKYLKQWLTYVWFGSRQVWATCFKIAVAGRLPGTRRPFTWGGKPSLLVFLVIFNGHRAQYYPSHTPPAPSEHQAWLNFGLSEAYVGRILGAGM